jgi:sporulation protein YlmC with PRC-barrel domain
VTRFRYHELVGSRVVDRDGNHLGRLEELVAAPRDDRTMEVTGLLLGYAGMAERFGYRRGRFPRREVDWDLVAGVSPGLIRLRITAAELRERLDARENRRSRDGRRSRGGSGR